MASADLTPTKSKQQRLFLITDAELLANGKPPELITMETVERVAKSA